MVMVSVVMPAYNAAKFIRESIDSVRNQSYDNWELVIVDDGSTDNTASIIKELAGNDNRIRYIYQGNGRQGKARNNGIKNSKGEYIAFLDADDLWMQDKLEKQMESLHATKADLVFSCFSTFVTGSDDYKKQGSYPGYYTGEAGVKAFLINNYIPTLTVVVKKKAVEEVNYFSENPAIQNAEDYHLWLKLLAAGKTIWGSAEVLAYYRVHSGSSSASDRHVIFPALNSLKALAKEYADLETLIKNSFLQRIDNYICQNNINEWAFLKRLLDIKKSITKRSTPFFLRKQAHLFLGKRVYRHCYIFFRKKATPVAADINLQEVLI